VPDEAERGQVAVKNLVSGEQTIVQQDAAVEFIRSILAGHSS